MQKFITILLLVFSFLSAQSQSANKLKKQLVNSIDMKNVPINDGQNHPLDKK